MTGFSVEIQSPEIVEAINNLAKAHILVAESLGRLAESGIGPKTADAPSETNDSPARAAAALPPVKGLPATAAPVFPEASAAAGAPYSLFPPTPTLSPPSAASSSPAWNAPAWNETGWQKTPEHTFTLDELARAAASLMSAGKYLLLVELLGRFGVQALFQLPKEHFAAFASALRQLGVRV